MPPGIGLLGKPRGVYLLLRLSRGKAPHPPPPQGEEGPKRPWASSSSCRAPCAASAVGPGAVGTSVGGLVPQRPSILG